ncbi:MAG TPA: hypothetical protein VHR66_04465 [Gemmataceae bacterium]|jgi:hypothetical protein|nr:hypothetical protein [Gemmataceae bacterium]
MALELHRRDDAADTEIRRTKVFPKWLTADQYEEIPLDESEELARVLNATLPKETLTDLVRLLRTPAAG